MTGEITLTLNDTPPSLNRVGYRSHWAVGRREKLRWQRDLELLLLAQKLPRPVKRVQARGVLRFPTLHRRDEGNYRAMLEKALGDALVRGGWLPDDTPEFFTFASLTFEQERGRKRTRLLISYE